MTLTWKKVDNDVYTAQGYIIRLSPAGHYYSLFETHPDNPLQTVGLVICMDKDTNRLQRIAQERENTNLDEEKSNV
jgi:hypothetical protein